MPVRIYEIAKKLGIESKDVLAKAKDLGIAGARVPSSSLDKITAEYLEEHLRPARAAVSEAPPPPPAEPERVLIVSGPPPEAIDIPAPSVEITTGPETDVPSAAPVPEATEAAVVPEEKAPPSPPEPPSPPAGPRVGDKVGFIQLPT